MLLKEETLAYLFQSLKQPRKSISYLQYAPRLKQEDLFFKKNNPKQIKAELCKKEIEEKFGFGKKKTKGK